MQEPHGLNITPEFLDFSLPNNVLLENALQYAPIVLWAVDRNGVFRLSTGKALQSLGLKPGEVLGQSVYDVYSKVPQIGEQVRRALAGEELFVQIRASGLVFQSYYLPLRDKNGQVMGVFGVATDITERIQAEEELQKRNRNLEAIYTIDRATAESLSLEQVLNVGLEAVLKCIKFESGAIYLREAPNGEIFQLVMSSGLSDTFSREVNQLKLGEDVDEIVRGERKTRILPISEYPFKRLSPQLIKEGLKMIAAAPLIAADRVIGILAVGSRQQSILNDKYQQLLLSAGIQLGSAIYRSQLHTELEQQSKELGRRVTELQGLNNLFQQYLGQRDRMRASHLELKQSVDRIRKDLDRIIEQLDNSLL